MATLISYIDQTPRQAFQDSSPCPNYSLSDGKMHHCTNPGDFQLQEVKGGGLVILALIMKNVNLCLLDGKGGKLLTNTEGILSPSCLIFSIY